MDFHEHLEAAGGLLEVCDLFPALKVAARFLQEELPRLGPVGSIVQIPVPLLLWTQDSIEQHLRFRQSMDNNNLRRDDRPCLWKSLDELFHGSCEPSDMGPLEVVVEGRNLWCLSNRRLTVLKMLQATQQHRVVWAPCIICRSDSSKFHQRLQTECGGLGIRPRGHSHTQSMHLGAPAFNQASQTLRGLERLVQKHPHKMELDTLLKQILFHKSPECPGEDTLTLMSDSECTGPAMGGSATRSFSAVEPTSSTSCPPSASGRSEEPTASSDAEQRCYGNGSMTAGPSPPAMTLLAGDQRVTCPPLPQMIPFAGGATFDAGEVPPPPLPPACSVVNSGSWEAVAQPNVDLPLPQVMPFSPCGGMRLDSFVDHRGYHAVDGNDSANSIGQANSMGRCDFSGEVGRGPPRRPVPSPPPPPPPLPSGAQVASPCQSEKHSSHKSTQKDAKYQQNIAWQQLLHDAQEDGPWIVIDGNNWPRCTLCNKEVSSVSHLQAKDHLRRKRAWFQENMS